jgi:3-hydroxyisobutyrate dehydrogenase-like beta-hydroxyacid dehydrogenase
MDDSSASRLPARPAPRDVPASGPGRPQQPIRPHRLGFVGVGVMGMPIVRNLLADGHQVTVYARGRSKSAGLADAGAVCAGTPAAAAAASEVTFTMVTDSAAVNDVVDGPDGVLAGAAPGSVWIDMSSIAPLTSRVLAERAALREVHALDAPVSGGEKGAISRGLAFMVGGDAETFARMRPLLESIGQSATHVGDHGAGQVAKVCNQMIVAATMCAVAEALVVARKCGVEPARVREAISGGAARSRILDDHAQRMLHRAFTPGFRISLLQKDLGIAIETARACGAAAPAAGQAAQFANALAALRGEVDASAVVEVFEMLASSGPVGEPIAPVSQDRQDRA